MLKKMVIFLNFSLIIQMNAMEKEEPTGSEQHICHLECMPLDVQTLIAYFLTCDDETKEEFIARTKSAEKLNLMAYYQYIPNFKVSYLNKELGASNFDKTKIAFLYFFNGVMQRFATVTIIDSIKKESTTHQLEPRDYQYIALSPQASMIATIEKSRIYPLNPTPYDGHLVRLYNLATQQERIIHTPKNITPLSIDFDRHGRRIIVYHKSVAYKAPDKKNKLEVLQHHTIFPLKITEDNTKPNEKSIPLLQKYFVEKGVCKCIRQ